MTRRAFVLFVIVGSLLLGAPGAEAADAVYGGVADLPALNCTEDGQGRVIMDLPTLQLVGAGRRPPTSTPVVQPTVGEAWLGLQADGAGTCMSATGEAWVWGELEDPLGTATYSAFGTFKLGANTLSFTGTSPELGADVFLGALIGDAQDGTRPLTLAKLRFNSLVQ